MMSLILYYLTLAALLAASLSPEHRVWGLAVWAYYPLWVPLSLFGLGAAAPGILRAILLKSAGTDSAGDTPPGRFAWVSGGVMIVMVLMFVLMRARTFFHGDGYQLLGAVAADVPGLKWSSFGESALHIGLRQIIGGEGREAALLSFQIIAVAAGLAAMVMTIWAARRLFSAFDDRVVFFAGIISSGYMLLFFGHVEYYSLFVASVLAFGMVGILALEGRIGRHAILWPLLVAIFMHSLGVVLLPAALYVLLCGSRAAHGLARLSRGAKALIVVALAASGIGAVVYVASINWSFRFYFLTPWKDRFTVDGYTWFSGSHLLDLANLLLVLLPALPMLMGLLGAVSVRAALKRPTYRFLLIALISVLGVVFVLDPRLGMARDWNLFSFAGVPLTLLAFYTLIDNRDRIHRYRLAGALAVLLGGLVLFPRAQGLADPRIALAHFDVYRYMDLGRSWDAGAYLQVYYTEAGQPEKGDSIAAEWWGTYPAAVLHGEAAKLSQRGKNRQAADLLSRAIRVNPKFWNAWASLGAAYGNLRVYDSAEVCFQIAVGLNPSNAIIYNNWGYACFQAGQLDRAEEMWTRSLAFDSTMYEPLVGMATLSKSLNRDWDYREYMRRACSRRSAPLNAHLHFADYLSKQGELAEAAQQYRQALSKGVDTALIVERLNAFPDLRTYLVLPAHAADTSD